MNDVTLILVIIILCVLFYYYISMFTYVKSKIDGKYYKVKNNSMKQESADTLAEINSRLLKLIDFVKNSKNPPEYAKRLDNFDPSILEENIFDIDTAYTLNKGSAMIFCLTSRDKEKKMYDINSLMFVAIHELAHIVTLSFDHTEEFIKNNTSLLLYAISAGLYKYVDYKKEPLNYCGLNINSNLF